jgi:hypothetical protein
MARPAVLVRLSDMDAKQAIAKAKQHLSEMFADELTSPPTLEEIWLDDMSDQWNITLGVRRPSNFVERDLWRDPLGSKSRAVPDYKVVKVSHKTGEVGAVLSREHVRV